MSKKGNHDHFGTESEFLFIDGLGLWSEHGYDKEMLLRNYLQALDKRNKWTKISRVDVINYATRKLDELVKQD